MSIPTEAEIEALKVDAERWRALMSSARMHYMGSAGIRLEPRVPGGSRSLSNFTPIPRLNESWHFGMEFWSQHRASSDPHYSDVFERELMVAYVDAIRGK